VRPELHPQARSDFRRTELWYDEAFAYPTLLTASIRRRRGPMTRKHRSTDVRRWIGVASSF
jgi:hypothetical protein